LRRAVLCQFAIGATPCLHELPDIADAAPQLILMPLYAMIFAIAERDIRDISFACRRLIVAAPATPRFYFVAPNLILLICRSMAMSSYWSMIYSGADISHADFSAARQAAAAAAAAACRAFDAAARFA